ncbi:MAG: alkaline shock response membrane anchor protein AmaP [Alicyclobacillus mali]|uniref:alkaline shock response membrane anchor protein AmaP n=1 Tax=Alicyclobacillus mali (ex Roth et al. 2021) TaxID=1123961 RepID=UPI0023F08370|nr:alkaline shock response membrane anchor protein AmaP [Alicyclobacillus mali (ex Roth et al. 2021)]MCL6487733.1 alkaline shock response membrane anchor protein AmaP [Alicyclobacillus mali (ex Roth et al. 2021)]
MNVGDRFLLFVLSLVGLVLGVLLALLGAGVMSVTWAASQLTVQPWNDVCLVVGVVCALLSIRFLFYRSRRRGSGVPAESVLLAGDHGQIRISYATLRQLANRRGSQLKGAESFDSRVRQGREGILIACKMQVLPDIDIAALTREAQTAVKEYVERTAGVQVERVIVHVTELSPSGHAGKAWNGA